MSLFNSCRIWSPTGFNIPHPLLATHCLYIMNFDTGKGRGGRVEPERRLEVERQQFTKLGQKYQHDSDKHLPQSPFTGKFFR
jgi:hypothetical protein